VAHHSFHFRHALSVFTALAIAGCGGDYSGDQDSSGSNSGRSLSETETPSSEPRSTDDILTQYFATHIEPQMPFCGTCHAPGGIADTELGRRFMLNNGSDHYDAFYAAWDALGKGVGSNNILAFNADSNVQHTGGKSWPANSPIYTHVATLLLCWDQPDNCPLTENDEVGENEEETPPTGNGNLLPLLGSSHGNHIWNSFCEDNDDDAQLPADPRTLITPGVNDGRAIFYNAFYEDCHVNLPEQEQAPKTCGEYRTRVAKGDYFANQRAAMTDLAIPASTINNLWKHWKLSERPDNFDELLTERYGFNPAPYRNPYPLPGEDPVLTDGGSGQLPMGLIQGRDELGNYNGKITINCYICHGGQIGHASEGEGLGPIPGMGNTNTDMMILMRDLSNGLVGALPISLNNVRGTSNAVGAFDMLTMIWDVDTLSLAPNPFKLPFTHSYHGNQDMPNWWNVSHRPRKFFDGGLSVDATRIDMAAAYQLNLLRSGATRRAATEEHDQDLQAYVDAQVAPVFPGDINTALAEAGAVIFHNKNLWADGANADIPRPQGNGSCASCHGAYSPRYVNDPTFLETPALEGVAGYIVPLDIIQTDPARALAITSQVREVFASSWWGYPDGADGYQPPGSKNPLDEYLDDMAWPLLNPDGRPVQGACGWAEDFGYLAPPLYGVWASSPYLHNGSVPTLRQVLKPAERPAIWKRLDSPTEGQIKGFDMSLAAYDLDDQVGWRYVEYCSSKDMPLEECDRDHRVVNNLLYQFIESIKDNFWLAGFISKPYLTQKQIDARKIFNTHEFSNANSGHEFTDVLSEAETRAVIEYLKTL